MEIRKNDSIIESETGVKPTSILYPFNAMTPQVRAVCEEGKVGARLNSSVSDNGPGCTAASIDTWLHHYWAIGGGVTTVTGFIQRGISGMSRGSYGVFFVNLLSKKDSVWVDTFSEYSSYVKERNAVTLINSLV